MSVFSSTDLALKGAHLIHEIFLAVAAVSWVYARDRIGYPLSRGS